MNKSGLLFAAVRFSLSKKYITVVRLHKIELFGEPLDRVPHAKTIHRIVLAPLLIFKSQEISQSADCDQGFAFGNHRLLKKAGENFFIVSLCTFI